MMVGVFPGKNLFFTAAFVIFIITVASCASAGGKGIPRVSSTGSEFSRADSAQPASDDETALPPSENNMEQLRSMGYAFSPSVEIQPSVKQDPYNLLPADWPADIEFHPDAIVVKAGDFGQGVISALAIVPRQLATPLGIQNYYLSRLVDWETIRVSEKHTDESDPEQCIYFIFAETPGRNLEICTGALNREILEQIPGEFLQNESIGENPLWIKISVNQAR